MIFFQKNLFSYWSSSAFCLAIMLVLFCTRDYNPFTDPANANVYVTSWSFSQKDSVSLYETGTFKVVVSVPQEIDSFILASPKNHYWRDTTLKPAQLGNELDGGPFLFKVAFYDTGLQTSVLTAYRSNGEKLTQEFDIHVYNPLQQDEVRGFFGDTTILITVAVPDKEVLYHWSFSGGNWNSSSALSRYPAIVPLFSPSYGSGALWVTDLSGNHPTPTVAFTYSFDDTIKPFIQCLNNGMAGDTILTGDTLFPFRAFITDGGGAAVESCLVNGEDFDFVNRNTRIYTKLFTTPSDSTPVSIIVYALDNLQFRNIARDTFHIVYRENAPTSNRVAIDFERPASATVTTSQTTFRISGTAQSNSGGDTMKLICRINDGIDPSVFTVIGTGGWSWLVPLSVVNTSVTVEAHGTDGRLLASALRMFVFNPEAVDSISPVISQISTGSQIIGSVFYTDRNVLPLAIVAFDDQSGMAYLVINQDTIPADTTSQVWERTTRVLEHSTDGNPVRIVAVDRNNNTTVRTVVIFRNSPPQLTVAPTFPSEICAENTYTTSIGWKDADEDPTSLETIHVPEGMTVSADGAIRWQPALHTDETSRLDTLAINLSDSYQKSRYDWTFPSSRCNQSPVSISFTTTEAEFDKVLQVGVDQLYVPLAITSTGLTSAPKYSAVFKDNGKPLIINDASSILQWSPSVADTGTRRLIVTVGDGSQSYDTLFPVLQVVPKNQYPCSLSVVYTGDTTSTGVLDLFTHPEPETLYFSIHDRDHPLTESYKVTISLGGVRSVQYLGQEDNFFITVEPDSSRLVQVLSVSLRDSTGTGDSTRFIIQYGSTAANIPPVIAGDPGFPIYFCKDTVYTFSIAVFDPDSDRVEVVTVHAPAGMTVSGDGQIQWVIPATAEGNDSLVVRLFDQRDTSGSYRWPLTVLDCKNLPPPVRFQTTSADFPSVLQTDINTIALLLTTLPGTGVRPFTYAAQLDNGMNLMNLNDTTGKLFWIPTSSDTGSHTIRISVRDRYNTADTLSPRVTIVPRNHAPCSLSYTYSGITLPSGQLSLFTATQPESALFVISDADHPVTERYNVTIRRRAATPVTQILSGDKRTFTVKINPQGVSSTPADTIVVSVNDSTGTTDTTRLLIRYPITGPGSIGQLSLLLSASTGVTTQYFSNKVSQWSYGFNYYSSVAQMTDNRQPMLVANAVNGQPAIDFSTSNDRDDDALLSNSSSPWANAPFTVFVVFSATTLPTDSRKTLLSTNAANAFGIGITCENTIGILNDVGKTSCLATDWSGTDLSVTAKTWYVMSCKSALGIPVGGTIRAQAWLNGTAATQAMELATKAGNGLAVGAGSGTFNGAFDGSIASIIIYTRALTEDERALVEHYLGKTYGILIQK